MTTPFLQGAPSQPFSQIVNDFIRTKAAHSFTVSPILNEEYDMTLRTSKTLITLLIAWVIHSLLYAAPSWKVGLYSFEDEVRATFTEDGIGKYTLRFGYGGCVASLLDHDNDYTDTFSGPYNGEETDRVLQTVLWGTSRNANTGTHYSTRWNVNQAGTFENVPAEIVSFHVVTNQMLEVYSINGNQWYQRMDENYRGSQPVSQYTRYSCEPGGVLSIRTITRIPRITVLGAAQESFTAYIEHWSAFKNVFDGHGFNAVARRATAEGSPNWWYATTNPTNGVATLPDYPNWPLSDPTLDGYAFAFHTEGPTTQPVAAMVFGKHQVQRPASHAWSRAVLNFKYWLAPTTNPGIGILPGIYLRQALPGTLVDFEYKLILRPASTAEFMTQVTHSVENVIPPRIYEPEEAVPRDLQTIKENLNQMIEHGWEGRPSKTYWEDQGTLHHRIKRLRSEPPTEKSPPQAP